MKFNDALEEVGGLGYYQITLYFMVSVLQYMSADSIKMNFMAAEVPHWCQVDAVKNFSFAEQQYIAIPTEEGKDEKYSNCYRFPMNFSAFTQEELINWNRSERTGHFQREDWISCDSGWTYDRWQFAETINSKWDLVCGSSLQVQLVGTIYMAGRLVGSISAGISDKIGRKHATTIFNVVKIVGGIIASFVPYYPAFVVGRFFIGVGSIGAPLVAYVLLSEIVAASKRSFITNVWLVQFVFGYCVICGAAYFVRDFSNLQIVYTFPMVFTLILPFSMDESPRWLMSQGRDEEAIKILNKMATINGRPQLQVTDFNKEREQIKALQALEGKKPTIADLVRTPNMRKKTCIMYFDWFTTSLIFYGLALNSGTLAGDIFLNTFLMGVVEIPAKIAGWLLMDVPALGRRTTLALSLLFGALTNILAIPLFYGQGNMDAGRTALAIIGKMGTTIAFSGVYILAAELFPTTVRNIGVGSSSMCSRIANLATPFMGAPLKNIWDPLPSAIFGGLATVAGGLTFLLPETINNKLPETIEEAEAFGKGQICSCCESCGEKVGVNPVMEERSKNIGDIENGKPSNGTATSSDSSGVYVNPTFKSDQ